MRKHISLTVLFVTVLFLVGMFPAAAAWSAKKMPSFSLEDVVTGKKVTSASFADKSLLVTFFATWCPPCIQEIPNLIDLQEEYRGQGFTVVGISVDQEKRVVRDLVTDKDINYPVVMADKAVTRNFGGVYGIPTSFLVNSNGTVVKKYTGYVPHSTLVRDIEQIIK